ncbi:MAG: hypothetical protein WDM89_07200 [Rhizomicrobium sp.]
MVNRVVPAAQLADEALKIAGKLAEKSRFAMALAKQAMNFVDDLQGKRSAMDGVFAMHHLAHAHNQMTTGTIIGGQTADTMKKLNRGRQVLNEFRSQRRAEVTSGTGAPPA